MRAEILLQHGWGFDSRVWGGWLPGLASISPSLVIHAAERGYYGTPAFAPSFLDKRSFKIIIAHSLGLHLLRQELLPEADAVFLLSGFLSFHPEDQLANKRSKRLVRAMKEKLGVTPYLVLRDFLKLCYAGEPDRILTQPPVPLATVPAGEPLDKQRLLEDLDILDHSDLRSDIKRIRDDATVCLIHGTADRVVSPEKSIELATVLRQSRLLLVENGTHALPTTHTSMCVGAISDTVARVMETHYAHTSS